MKVDFYEGAYGETLRIELSSQDDLMLLMSKIEKIISGVEPNSLIELTNSPCSNLYVALAPRGALRISPTGTSIYILWQESGDQWLSHLELLLGMQDCAPCHQYLRVGNKDRFLVEISYMESQAV